MASLGTVLEVTVDHLTPALVGGGIGIQVYGRNRKMVPLPLLSFAIDLLRCLSRISETINRTSSANTGKLRRALMCPTKRFCNKIGTQQRSPHLSTHGRLGASWMDLIRRGGSCCFRARGKSGLRDVLAGPADRAVARVRELRDRHLAACDSSRICRAPSRPRCEGYR